jgi:hypothetical protein
MLPNQKRVSILTKNLGNRGPRGAAEVDEESLGSLPTPSKLQSSSLDVRDQHGNYLRNQGARGHLAGQSPKFRREASYDPGKTPPAIEGSSRMEKSSLLQQTKNNHSISLLPQISPSRLQAQQMSFPNQRPSNFDHP